MIQGLDDLISYLRVFHRSWSGSPGLDPATVPDDLPDGLARLYRELGALIELQPSSPGDGRAPFAAQDCLLPLSRLERIDGMVEFAWENQGNWSCRCPLGPGDPPVYSNAADLWSDDEQGFVVVCESLNHFLITLCLQEAVMGCRHLFSLSEDHLPGRISGVEVRPLWLAGRYVFDEPGHNVYEVPGKEILLMRYASEGVFAGSPSAADLGEQLAGSGVRASPLY